MPNSKTEILDVIRNIVSEEGYDYIDSEFSLRGENSSIRVYADRIGGITISECRELNRRIGDYLESEEMIEGNYRLEVSSPGIDRPLKSQRDFKRNVGRDVTVRIKSEGQEKEVTGEIISADSVLVLSKDEGVEIELAFDNIVQGKIKVKW